MIVLFHCRTQGLIFNNPFVSHGYLFVDFFFVLSGFVISNSYADKISKGFSIGRFMFLRWGRIYPLHLAMLLVYVAFDLRLALRGPAPGSYMPFTGSHSFTALTSNLFLVQIFAGSDSPTWNAVSWSIAAEFWTYLVSGVMFRGLRSWLVPASLALALASGVSLLFLTDKYISVTHNGAFERCLYGFALGVVADRLFSLRLNNGWKRIGVVGASLLETAMLIIVIGFVVLAGGNHWSLISPLIFVLAIPVFAKEGGVVSRLLLTRPLLLLGMLSYSIYMIHVLLLYRLVNLLELASRITQRHLTVTVESVQLVGGGQLFSDAMSIALLAITIGAAWVTYHLIELPGRNWSRRQIFFAPTRAPATQSDITPARSSFG